MNSDRWLLTKLRLLACVMRVSLTFLGYSMIGKNRTGQMWKIPMILFWNIIDSNEYIPYTIVGCWLDADSAMHPNIVIYFVHHQWQIEYANWKGEVSRLLTMKEIW